MVEVPKLPLFNTFFQKTPKKRIVLIGSIRLSFVENLILLMENLSITYQDDLVLKNNFLNQSLEIDDATIQIQIQIQMDEQSKALQAFTHLCARYELRPTNELFDYLLDLVQDPDVDARARFRGFMALKCHHPWEVSPIGVRMIQQYLKNPEDDTSPSFLRVLMSHTLARDEAHLGELHRDLMLSFFRFIQGTNAYELIRECCRPVSDTYVSYRVHTIHERSLLQVGLPFVPMNHKLDVAYISFNRGALTVDCCNHLYNNRTEVGYNLWDFFYNLEDHQFTRFRLLGQQFIAQGGGLDQELQLVGNQNVHKLDKYRGSFLSWLANQTFLHEDDPKRDYINAMISAVYSNNGRCTMTLNHIKDTASVFSFLVEENVYNEYTRKIEIKLNEFQWNLFTILRRMIWFIAHHQHRQELQKRLIEELIEMQGTCVSGHLNRIFNCLIGFEDILQISPEDNYKFKLRERLDQGVAGDEELLDAIIMAEWTDATKERCANIANASRRDLLVALELQTDDDEEKWFYEVVYKWSGLDLKAYELLRRSQRNEDLNKVKQIDQIDKESDELVYPVLGHHE